MRAFRAWMTAFAAAFAIAACGGDDGAAPSTTPDGSAPEGGTVQSDGGPPGADGATDAGAGEGAAPAPDASSDGEGSDGGSGADLEAQAASALQALLLSYWSGGASYVVDTPGGATAPGYWIFAQTFDTLLDGVERTGGEHYAGLIETFYEAQAAKGWSSNYYDDENWMALALIRAYDLTKNAAYLAEAKSLYADIMAAWDTSCCGATPGGIWWDRAHTQKATAANAGPVITGARLSQRTGQANYLTFAKQAYDYWTAHMVDPSTHAVIDHIDADGTLVRYKFTYNEGLVIGAAVELAGVTGDPSTLILANAVASYMLAHETESTSAGTALMDGTNGGCTGDCAEFKGIGFRYLAALAKAQPTHPEYAALLSTSAAAVWQLARDPATTRFSTDWAGPSLSTPPLQADSSATMALEIFAELAGTYVSDGSVAAGILEAEESTLHGLGLEARYAGFDGWAYVAGWNADGQWVDFHYPAPAAATYTLDLRYAAGAGAASRLVFVNGQAVVPNHPFPSTGAWTSYASTPVQAPLVMGDNTVSIIFNSSMGSGGYLNLDRVTVHP